MITAEVWLIHANNETTDTPFVAVPRSVLYILVVDGKSRRCAMVPQNASTCTGNGKIPGCNIIISVVTKLLNRRFGKLDSVGQKCLYLVN